MLVVTYPHCRGSNPIRLGRESAPAPLRRTCRLRLPFQIKGTQIKDDARLALRRIGAALHCPLGVQSDYGQEAIENF